MTVIFARKSKKQNRFTISNIEGHGKIWFHKGTFQTSNKDLIEKLLNSKLYERGDYHLITNPDLVEKYLSGEEPDKLTKDVLNSITRQGILELGELLKTRNNQPTLIKIELVGKPITTEVRQILDFYRTEENYAETGSQDKQEVVRQNFKEEVRKEKSKEIRKDSEELTESSRSENYEDGESEESKILSTDMNVVNAVNYIKDQKLENLEGFVPEEEERVTVLRAWKEKNANTG